MPKNSILLKITYCFLFKLKQIEHKNIRYILFLVFPSHSGQALLFQVYVLQIVQQFPAQMPRKFNDIAQENTDRQLSKFQNPPHLVIKAHSIEYLPKVFSRITWASVCRTCALATI